MIPTENIGSLPRPAALRVAQAAYAAGQLSESELAAIGDAAVAETLTQLAALGASVLTDGEQTKPSFATYPLAGRNDLDPTGVVIPFADGHTRRLPTITAAPFAYTMHAADFVCAARRHTTLPVKQAVIAASALSLVYPAAGIAGYSRDEFITDLVNACEADIRGALEAGAASVQVDFTEGRLALKLDPSGGLLDQFVALNNQVLSRFSPGEKARIGVHTCPGGDLNSTHSADVDYADLLPALFELQAATFYIALAGEREPDKVLATVRDHRPSDARVFVGVIDVCDPRIETAEQVRDRVLQSAQYIPVEFLGSCDDCGFAPFADDTSTPRETAFAKVSARIRGTAMASDALCF